MVRYSVAILVLVVSTELVSPVNSCPRSCQCRWSGTVNCTNLSSLQTLVAEIPSNTVSLQIRSSTFYKMSDTDLAQMPAKDLQNLEISLSRLQEIHSNAFSSVPLLKELILNHNEIKSIQKSAFHGLQFLERLDLSRNQLRSLSSAELFEPLQNVMHIDISINKLSNFPNGIFSQQSRLLELNVDSNQISNLRGTFFHGARNLQKLSASHCRISTIENDFFSAVSSIDTLDLSYNELTALPNTWTFAQLRSLRNLTFKGNGIYSLVEDQFSGLNLETLDLSNNKISSINPNAFKYTEGVRSLDLSSNSIQTLPSFIFQPVASGVTRLRLGNNRLLVTLPDRVFSGMEKLQEVDLSHCSFRNFNEEHFRTLTNLKTIDISHNLLQSLPQTLMNRINMNTAAVNLDKNAWHCDCMIKPLRNWLQLSNTGRQVFCKPSTVNSFNCPLPTCSTPANLANHGIVMLSDRDLGVCENTGAVSSVETNMVLGAVLGAIGGVILIIVIVIVVMCCYRRHKRGDPILCVDKEEMEEPPRKKSREKTKVKRNTKKDQYYIEKKERRNIDPEIGSLNESDKSFVVRNYFHSMNPDPDAVSDVTQSMTRKDSVESLSQSGYGYGSRRGSRQSSQYSLNAGYKIESAV